MSYPQHEPPQGKPFGPEDGGYPAEPEKKGHGCFFYGCITLIVLGVLALVACGIIGYAAYSWANGMIQTYTSTAPDPLPAVNITDEQRKELDDRWDAFKKALDEGEAAELVLTSDDINAKIAENNDFKGKVYVTIKDGELSGKVSFPLDQIPLCKGRYFNGSVVLKASIEDGDLDVRLQSAEANGKKMPDDVAKQFAGENLAKNMNDPDTRAFFKKFESMEIKGDKVILKAKAKKKDKDKDKQDEEPKAKEDMPKDDAKAKDKEPPPAKDEAKEKEKPTDAPKDKEKTDPPAPKDKEDLPKAA